MTAAPVVIPYEDVATSTAGTSESIEKLWRTSMLPVGADNITNAAQGSSNYDLLNGIYMVQQYTGTRALYTCEDNAIWRTLKNMASSQLPGIRCIVMIIDLCLNLIGLRFNGLVI